MSVRKGFASTHWFTSSLMLLATVAMLSAGPMRTPIRALASPSPVLFGGGTSRTPARPTVHAKVATEAESEPRLTALLSEEEEVGESAPDGPGLSLFIPWSGRNAADHPLVAPLSTLSLYHLRC